jgi:hypothetical protein
MFGRTQADKDRDQAWRKFTRLTDKASILLDRASRANATLASIQAAESASREADEAYKHYLHLAS